MPPKDGSSNKMKKGVSDKKNRGEAPEELPPLVGWKPRPETPRPEPQRALNNSEERLELQIQREMAHRRWVQDQMNRLLAAKDWEERGVHLPPVTEAPITTQNHAPMTTEAVVPQSSTNTTASITTTIPLPHPPMGPRPPNVPKRNVGNREVLVRQRSDGAMVIVPKTPDLISLDMPPVTAPKPQPPPTKPGSNRRNTNKFHKVAQKSDKHGHGRTTKPSDEQKVQQTYGPRKPHPPPKRKPDRLLYKRPQISNTENIYLATDQGQEAKITSDHDDQHLKDETGLEKDVDVDKKPAKFTAASRAHSSEPEEIPEELSA